MDGATAKYWKTKTEKSKFSKISIPKFSTEWMSTIHTSMYGRPSRR